MRSVKEIMQDIRMKSLMIESVAHSWAERIVNKIPLFAEEKVVGSTRQEDNQHKA